MLWSGGNGGEPRTIDKTCETILRRRGRSAIKGLNSEGPPCANDIPVFLYKNLGGGQANHDGYT